MKRDKIDENAQKLSELNEKYLRALADYQNLQKQTESWREEFVQYANSDLVTKILEVLDNLEKAQEHLQDEGLKLIIGKLHNILREQGVEELELSGKEYNPAEAEVISTKPGEENNRIAEVAQKGYRLKDKVIRPAKVVVSTNNQETRDNNQSNDQQSSSDLKIGY
jgi:molecular chaperone GrpE